MNSSRSTGENLIGCFAGSGTAALHRPEGGPLLVDDARRFGVRALPRPARVTALRR